MPRKSGQGRVTNNKGFLSKASGNAGGLCSVIRGGKVYLGYKVSGSWYYTEMTKRPYDSSRKVLPPRYDNIKNNNKEKIVAKKLKLNYDLVFDSPENMPNSSKGIALHVGRSLGNVDSSQKWKLKVADIITPGGETLDSLSLVSFDDWFLDASNANVTTTNAITLSLGVPSNTWSDGSTSNNTITNTYSLSLDGNIKSNNLVIDDAGDITLDAAGADIAFAVGGTSYLGWSAVGTLIMKSALDTNDYFQIAVGTEAATTLTTFQSGGTNVGHFKVVSNGDITLDSGSGKFIAKNATTEFSVANSAFAGMILGYTTVGIDAAAAYVVLSTTMTCLNDAMKVKFVAPPSGVVEIMAQIYFDAARRIPALGLSDENATTGYSPIDFPNSNDVTNEHVQSVPPSSLGDHMLRPHWVVTGLTPGTAYEWWIAGKITSGSGGALRWGGTATNQYPPFIMKATALPKAVTDFAVYG